MQYTANVVFNGSTSVFQTDGAGSNPVVRSKNKEEYPSGLRGRSAKALGGGIPAREFESPLFRQSSMIWEYAGVGEPGLSVKQLQLLSEFESHYSYECPGVGLTGSPGNLVNIIINLDTLVSLLTRSRGEGVPTQSLGHHAT